MKVLLPVVATEKIKEREVEVKGNSKISKGDIDRIATKIHAATSKGVSFQEFCAQMESEPLFPVWLLLRNSQNRAPDPVYMTGTFLMEK